MLSSHGSSITVQTEEFKPLKQFSLISINNTQPLKVQVSHDKRPE